MKNNCDITQIISQQAIQTFFQPIISIRQKCIVGLESLSRGIDGATGDVISPEILFDMAEARGVTVELDRLCREKALAAFQSLSPNQELFLSLNFKTSIIDQEVAGSGHLLKQVLHYHLNPENIIIEIVESAVKNLAALADFVQQYKDHGFLIALDDFGAGYSNLDRVAVIKPDIIKIDRSLLHRFDQEYYKQEMVKSLIVLSHKLGALALAEGIERTEEALLALEFGADMLQGHYFSKPVPGPEINLDHCQGLIHDTAAKYQKTILAQADEQKFRNEQLSALIDYFVTDLSNIAPENFDERLLELIGNHASLECVYILDETGIQVSNTILNYASLPKQKRRIFAPAHKGADQSLKEYYLPIRVGLSRYITEPYVSAASGNACVTISALFTGVGELKYVLCLDVRA
jgi:EAL domain-containing protein (putative c-di-GMP-specific phosphodiesterase class I)